MCLILQKVFLFLLVAFTFDGKVPSKTQHDMKSVVNKDHELFTNQYFAVADMIRSNCLKEQFSLYALSKLEFSKLKFSKHYYSQTLFLDKLRKINFPDYSNFKDINNAYSDFTGRVTSVIDEIAPIKEIRVKNNSQDWFDAEINEEIERRDKSLAKFKKSRLHSDNESYKKARNKVQRMIKDKKKIFLPENLMKI